LRDYLAKLVRERAPKLRGNANPLRDLFVFDQVEAWLVNKVNAPIYDYIKKNDLSDFAAIAAFHQVPKNERPDLQEAYRHFTDGDGTVELEAFQKQYERGRKNAKDRI